MPNQWFYRASDLSGTAKSRREGERGVLRYSPAVLWRKVRAGLFVPPIKLSANISAFPSDEVRAIIKAQKAGATDDELRRLVAELIAARKRTPAPSRRKGAA